MVHCVGSVALEVQSVCFSTQSKTHLFRESYTDIIVAVLDMEVLAVVYLGYL